MRRWIGVSQASGVEFSVVIIDLDYFKSINDAFGHLRGDQALVEVTARIKASIRREDQLFRYGGDEFVILLPGSSRDQALRVVERIRETMTSEPLSGVPPVLISASYGLATYPEDAHTPEGLFAVIDRRLYQGKALGRGRIIAEETEVSSDQRLKPPERMVERDYPYQQAQRFLEQLPLAGGALQISGRPGSGRSRFLVEVTRLARLQGYAVWSLHGSPALRFRKGSILAQFQRAAGLEHVHDRPADLLNALQNWVADQRLAGLLLSIDDIEDVDSLSLEVISAMLAMTASPAFPLGLIFSCRSGGEQDGHELFPGFDQIRQRTVVEMRPVTEAGLRIWLRYSLNWEPSEHFASWFWQQTAGMPGAISGGLQWMYEQGLLRPQAEGWSISALPEQLGRPAPNDQAKSNLPVIVSDLYGREEEVWRLKDLLDTRMPVSIIGPDGMGKSRLALQLAAELRDAYPGGVFWLSLRERPSRDDFLYLLARLMEYKVRSYERIEEEIFQLYQNSQVLLVLDSLASGSPAALLAVRLFDSAPGLQILSTSVLPQNFPQERVLALQGLAVSDEHAPTEEIERCPAVQLFLAIARASGTGFQPQPEDMPSIGRICHLVEGMPLAIELAAAWVSSFSCAEIAGRIQENIHFLSQPAGAQIFPSQPAGPGGITAVMDGFWRLFSPGEQRVLSALSVFSHSFTIQAAGRVAEASPFFLDALSAKKYLRVFSSQRYSMHLLLAGYAAAQLRTEPDLEDTIRRRHADEYLGRLAEHDQHLVAWYIADPGTLQDLDNYRHAWQYAIQSGNHEQLQRSLPGLYYLFFTIGYFMEGIRLVVLALESLPATPQTPADRLLRASLLARLGEFHFHIGRYSQGLPILEEAVSLLQSLNAPDELAEVLRLLANLVGAMGDYDQAIHLLEQGLGMTQPETNPHLYFNLLNRAGVTAYYKKDYLAASAYLERALEIGRRINDPSKIAVILNNQGNVAIDCGRLIDARHMLEESLALCRNLGQITLHASVLDSLAKAEVYLNQYPSARRYFIESLQLLQSNDAVPLVLEILVGVSEMWQKTGSAACAAELLRYILHYGASPADVRRRATRLAASPCDPTGPSRWKDRPLRWVVMDVIEMLSTGEC